MVFLWSRGTRTRREDNLGVVVVFTLVHPKTVLLKPHPRISILDSFEHWFIGNWKHFFFFFFIFADMQIARWRNILSMKNHIIPSVSHFSAFHSTPCSCHKWNSNPVSFFFFFVNLFIVYATLVVNWIATFVHWNYIRLWNRIGFHSSQFALFVFSFLQWVICYQLWYEKVWKLMKCCFWSLQDTRKGQQQPSKVCTPYSI